MIYEISTPRTAASLFKGFEDGVVWGCLDSIMGRMYATSAEHPSSAMIILGDFCFLAGEPVEELILYKPDWCRQDFMIMVPQNLEWEKLIENCYQSKAKKVTRYAIKKEADIFDKDFLQSVVDTLPDSYEIKLIDEKLFWKCHKTAWCKDWVANYPDYELFQKHGLGIVITKDGTPVSGASSYCGFQNGIEIEIITKEEYRRKGLACVCGAKLILECLKRGWYPSWDAQNVWSKALAQKLGYHFDKEYITYEIRGY